MSWLDPFFLFFRNGAQLPARRRVAIGSGLSVVDDAANDQIVLDVASTDDGPAPVVAVTSAVLEMTKTAGDIPYFQFNGTGLNATEFPSGPVYKLSPVTVMQVELSPDGDSSSYHPTVSFGAEGVAVGWLVYVIARGGSTTSFTIRNIADGAQPLIEIIPDDYIFAHDAGDPRRRVHTFVFTGTGTSSVLGRGWQRVTGLGTH
jgi:hypothetical protein